MARRFYPDDLPARRWLEYASRRFNSIELNGTFYSLKSPAVFERWVAEMPARDFVFAVKGGRFITHNLKLRRAERRSATSSRAACSRSDERTGPFLWQLPATYRFDAERMDSFMRLLPRTSREAEAVALQHDDRLRRGALVDAAAHGAATATRSRCGIRATSTRSSTRSCASISARFVVADTAGKFPYAEEVTADFVYVRLHGSRELYASGYTDAELDEWAAKIARVARVGARRVRLLRQRRQGARAVRRDAAGGASGRSVSSADLATTRTRMRRMERITADCSVWQARSLHRTSKDCDVVDGVERCAGAQCSTWRGATRPSPLDRRSDPRSRRGAA